MNSLEQIIQIIEKEFNTKVLEVRRTGSSQFLDRSYKDVDLLITCEQLATERISKRLNINGLNYDLFIFDKDFRREISSLNDNIPNFFKFYSVAYHIGEVIYGDIQAYCPDINESSDKYTSIIREKIKPFLEDQIFEQEISWKTFVYPYLYFACLENNK